MLTEVDVPSRMPALNILPLEQASTDLRLSGHTSTGQINFFLREDPEGGLAMSWLVEITTLTN